MGTRVRPAVLLFGFCLCAAAQTVPDAPYDWNERWHHYMRRTYSPGRIGMLALNTGADQLMSSDRGQALSYPDQIAANFFRRSARTTTELFAGYLLNEDIRRRPSGKTTIKGRALWAFSHALLAQNSDGNWRPGWSRFIGAAAGVSTHAAWSDRPMTGTRLLRSFSWTIQANLQDALMSEFQDDLRRFGSRFRPNWLRFSRR